MTLPGQSSPHGFIAALALLVAVMVGTGSAHSAEFGVNRSTVGDQQLPAVARTPDGRAVVVWESVDRTGGVSTVVAQRLGAGGGKKGPQIAVSARSGRQTNPAVAIDALGNFVVAWNSSTHLSTTTGAYARRFAADGTALGSAFRVNGSDGDLLPQVALAMNPSGTFLIAWPEREGTGLPVATNSARSRIVFRVFAIDGLPRTLPVVAARGLLTQLRLPDAGIDDAGGVVVTWNSDVQSGLVTEESSLGLALGVFGRRFSEDGVALGDSFRVDSQDANVIVDRPVVAVAGDGRFAVAWQVNSADSLRPLGVRVRRYDKDGNALLATVLVPDSKRMARKPSIAFGSGGRFAVAAHSDGLYLRNYDARGIPLGEILRVDDRSASGRILEPAIALDGRNGVLAVWQSRGQDGDGRGVRARVIASP